MNNEAIKKAFTIRNSLVDCKIMGNEVTLITINIQPFNLHYASSHATYDIVFRYYQTLNCLVQISFSTIILLNMQKYIYRKMFS